MIFDIQTPLDTNDIHSIIANSVSESIQIEFKRQLPKLDNDGKKEFLADVSAFLNCIGGKLIYGIQETSGRASKIMPLEVESRDTITQTLNQLLMNGLSPRGEVVFNWIDVCSKYFILEIICGPSPLSPHRVILNKHNEFYIRDDSGKHQMNVEEIRAKCNSFNVAKINHSEEYIRISTLFGSSLLSLSDMSFERCVLHGPGNVLFDGCDLLSNSFEFTEIIIVDPYVPINNAIHFRKCKINKCQIRNITWLMTKQFFLALPKDMQELMPVLTGKITG